MFDFTVFHFRPSANITWQDKEWKLMYETPTYMVSQSPIQFALYESTNGELAVIRPIGDSYEISSVTVPNIMEFYQRRADFDKTQSMVDEITNRTIPINTLVRIPGITDEDTDTIPCLVDTGADFSSMHVDEWEVPQGMSDVVFVVNGRKFISQIIDWHTIQAGDTTTRRPVINLNLEIKSTSGQWITSKCNFNLADRSNHDEQVIIGREFLQSIQAVVDTSVVEQVQLYDIVEFLEEQLK